MNNDLFGHAQHQPLAARMRPKRLEDYVGQQHILGQGKGLRRSLEAGQCHSMILWGPPGTGKTTLAEIIAFYADSHVERISAVSAGVKDIRAAITNAQSKSSRTLLFIDEVHRFNKSQQDALLPFIEDGTVTFIGATTENPSFELNNALLSRARVYLLKSLTTDDLNVVIDRALTSEEGLQLGLEHLTNDARTALIRASQGDARRLLNTLEIAHDLASVNEHGQAIVSLESIQEAAGEQAVAADKQGDRYYDLLSAFHKSIRGSSPDGALYWFACMLESGMDPLLAARRLLAIASEDVGNADPKAMQVALSAWDCFHRVGPAEGERAIAQAAVYMAVAPKSNAVYTAYKAARAAVRELGTLEVPLHLRNAPTELMKEMGCNDGYRYAHDEPLGFAAGENYLPDRLKDVAFYQPTERGLEKKITEKMAWMDELNKNAANKRHK
ncbi:replication-associated recombination protein A [Echinimonas agarilytica]|uniref:Replication-associated recombination protein A n=1 Tax=Echinimonas agarilytica TaxID=1215918 RepID=A0AA41W9A4_9GAMM|nr:replication-associated recombination protein A [Echinimonas agarilytica]MCM2680758.1 replication-associated recombination protein A [Echinimonas agarilytica]